MLAFADKLGSHVVRRVGDFGDFCLFTGRSLAWVVDPQALRWRNVRLLFPQLYRVGTASIPVVVIIGIFVGMVLSVQSVMQFRAIGREGAMGSLIILSVLRELGPVLAAVILAGRVGGGLAAELGTMRVTEQIDALRAMGSDPLRVLVVPRFLACVLLIPILTIYANFMGIVGGYVVSVHVYGVNPANFWEGGAATVTNFDLLYGPIKSLFFGSMISLICCYKGFTCRPGAAGVGRACTEAFVASAMAIIIMDFFLSAILNDISTAIYGPAKVYV
ncbi:MAG: ABC transporter permease [Phycisphaerae bacterium]|nr:ABC transporter permease [Phycisphaerae bacterium]